MKLTYKHSIFTFIFLHINHLLILTFEKSKFFNFDHLWWSKLGFFKWFNPVKTGWLKPDWSFSGQPLKLILQYYIMKENREAVEVDSIAFDITANLLIMNGYSLVTNTEFTVSQYIMRYNLHFLMNQNLF